MNQHIRSIRHVVYVLFVALLSFGAQTAAAQSGPKRIVVRDFTGPQAQRLHDALVSNLRANGFDVVEESEMESAAASAGVQLEDGWQYRVAQQLHISAVISGVVARHGRRFTLTVRVRNGYDGSSLGNEVWRGRNAAQLASIGENGHERLGSLLASSHAPEAEASESERPWQGGASDDEEAGDDEDEDGDDEDEDEGDEEAGDGDRYDSFRGALAIGTIARSMSANVVPTRLGGASEDRTYSSAGLGSGQIGADIEIYPGAFGAGEQAFPYVGLIAGYHHSLFLNTQGCDSTGSPCPTPLIDVPTGQQNFYFGVRGRYTIGHRRDGVELALDASYSNFTFSLDEAQVMMVTPGTRIPTFGYSNLALGLGVNIGVVPRFLTIGLRGAYRVGLSVSQDTRNAWGADTKGANGLGLGVNIRTEAPYIADGMFFGLGFEYLNYSTKFEGAPVAPWEQLAVPEAVSDNYYRLTLAIGYALR